MSDQSERVEQLESKVDELEATVRGLTEELVDATERIRQLESQTGVDPAGDHGRGDGETAADGGADPIDAGPEPTPDETAAGDTTKGAEAKDSTDTDAADDDTVVEDDDIIVA